MLPKQKLLHRWRVPLVDLFAPEVELPEFPPKIPKLDERQTEILRHALADDISGLVPIAGDLISDTSYSRLKELMTPDEYERFVELNKGLPSLLAAARVFSEKS